MNKTRLDSLIEAVANGYRMKDWPYSQPQPLQEEAAASKPLQISTVCDSLMGARGHLVTRGRSATRQEAAWIFGEDVPKPTTIREKAPGMYMGLPFKKGQP